MRPVESQDILPHSKKSIDNIRIKIQQRQLAEASRLFQKFAPGFQKKERDSLAEQLSTLVRQAKRYFREAQTHEQERELEQARAKYEKVKTISIDYPGLSESLNRVDNAIELIWALENRAARRKDSKGKKSVLTAMKHKSHKSRLWLIVSVCLFLQLIIIGAGLFYTDHPTFLAIKRNNTQQAAQSVQSKPPVLAHSSLQINSKAVPPEPVKETSPKLNKEVAENIVVAVSEQPQPATPPKLHQKKATTIPPGQTTSSETFYTVQEKDTLGLISQKKYGTVSKWPAIAHANRDQLEDNPNRLKVGMILIIPSLTEAGKTLPEGGPKDSSKKSLKPKPSSPLTETP